ncbi:MAG: hypothetical protein ACKVVT_01315 [Dehalococcoidia bacterium]
MSLSDDLLAQANRLTKLDPRRPQQANLRRAISSSYYALFHEIAAAGAARTSRSKPSDPAYQLAYRRFDHGTMREAAQAFIRQPEWIRALPGSIPPTIVEFSKSFVALQQERHVSDYDPARKYTRTEARELVARSEGAIHEWRSVRLTSIGQYFLLVMLLGKPRS